MSKTGPNGMIIRGMTFYKSEPDPMVADDGEPGENCECKPSVSFKGSSREKTSQLCLKSIPSIFLIRPHSADKEKDSHKSLELT